MADVAINAQSALRGGIVPAYTGSLLTSNVYTVQNDGRIFLHFKKSGAGACTVTVETPGTVEGLAIADQTFVVPATTGDVMAGPFPPQLFNDQFYNLRFSCSDIVGLTVAVVRV